MRTIDKFILHVVHNWKNQLNEAYSEKAVQTFLKQFKEEADDLNIQISDGQLRKYIERFDTIKNSPKIAEKDLSKWSLSNLIKLVTASPGADVDEEEDTTPDVVYQDNGITIWNGAKENNCITYGRNERWCITRGSWAGYRYGNRLVTFYLAKNSNLPDSNPTSFVVVHVDENGDYGISLRPNNGDKTGLTWTQMINNAPWLGEIPNIRQILKYIPLSTPEKMVSKYKNNPISVGEWKKFPFEVKKQYIVARIDSRGKNDWFSDITNEEFIEKQLSKYPDIAKFLAVSPGVAKPELLLRHLDNFSNQDRKSITANLRPIDLKFLKDNYIPFDVKKLLITLKKWSLKNNERIYATEDGSTIVLLELGNDIKMGLYQEEDNFPNVKLNQRTAKYLLEYKELDKIPLKNLIDLAIANVVDKKVLNTVLDIARKDENSAIKIKQFGDNEVLLDSNTLSSYKIENGKLIKVPFNDKDVQQLLVSQKENEGFQENIIRLLNTSVQNNENLLPTLDKEAIVDIVKATPYSKRLISKGVIVTPDGNGPENHTFIIKQNKNDFNYITVGGGNGWNIVNNNTWNNDLDEADWKGYFNYLRATNQIYSDNELLDLLRTRYNTGNNKKSFIKAKPPLNDNGRYAVAVQGEDYYVINKQNPRESFKISNLSNKLNKANIPPTVARRLLGQEAPQAAQAAAPGAPAVPRRGRPAGVPNAAPAAAVPAAAGNVNVPQRFQQAGLQAGYADLSNAVRRRIGAANGVVVPIQNNRGVTRRNNLLGAAGAVTSAIDIGPSTVYFIRLANNTTIASIVVQPGNGHYVVTANTAFALDSPAQLLQALQQRNLAEVHRYIVNEYFDNYPHHIKEFKNLLRNHINKIKNENK